MEEPAAAFIWIVAGLVAELGTDRPGMDVLDNLLSGVVN